MTPQIILASTSKSRQAVLKNAGIAVDMTINAGVNEHILKDKIECAYMLALYLSRQKALAVSAKYPDAYVIGGDQTLALGDVIYHKPANTQVLKQNLRDFSGKTHTLHAGIAVAKGEKIVFDGVWQAHMHMRVLSESFIDGYVAICGDKVLSSVGGYHFERLGVQLFDSVDGDMFTIMGLPLMPLCTFLREQGCLKS